MTRAAALLAVVLASQLFLAAPPRTDSLFQAIQKGDATLVKHLLNQGVNADSEDADGTPALLLAALYGSADCVKLLLDHGANPNARNAAGATPLHWAVPDTAKVKLLLAA